MSPSDPVDLNPVVRRFVQEAGHLTQSLGVGRVAGQIYAYLYFTPGPRSLSNLQRVLGISKGAASMSVRQLEQWGAVRKVWVRGDRKDYYEANDWFGRILRNVLMDTMGKRMEGLTRLIEEAEAFVGPGRREAGPAPADLAFFRERTARLRAFQRKLQDLWANPLVRMLLK